MNEAHVFQHQYTGLQIFVYHKRSEFHAKAELWGMVANPIDWIYLGKKVATDVN